MRVELITDDLLSDDIDYKDIIIWCLNNEIIDEDTAREKLELSNDDKLPIINKTTTVDLEEHYIDKNDILDNMWEDDIIDWMEDNGHIVDPTEQEEDEMCTTDRHYWIHSIKRFFNRTFTRVYNKEDFKKEINKMIDDELYY